MSRNWMIFLCLLPALSFANPKVSEKCGSSQQPVPWRYCISSVSGSPSHDVLYFFHGHGDNEHGWEQLSPDFLKEWQAAGKPAPVVVTISFGESWSLAEKNSGIDSGYFNIFVDTIMPRMEAMLPQPIGKRIMLGVSMGGLNALELALKRPQLFARAGLACPAFADIPPDASRSVIQDYIQRTHADPGYVSYYLEEIGKKFPDSRAWADASPLQLGQKLLGPASPKLFISTGSSDEFGFFTTSMELVQLAKSRGVSVEWKPVSGGHCSADIPALADFLVAGQ